MGECRALSPITPLCMSLPSGSGLCGIKRSHSSDDSDESSSTPKIHKYDSSRLIDSPERHTDPGSETEFTFQEEETDLCCRSTETSSSEWSERNAVGRVEFEIRSPNEVPNPFGDSSTASDASVNALQVIGLPPPKIWDDAGNSSCASSVSSDVFDPEIPRRDYWTCLQCSNVNNRPAFRYCEKCYKVRRDMYQPRVKPRKRRKRKSSKGVATAKNLAVGKANSERTTGTNKCQSSSITFGATVKSCDILKTSPVAFSGVKLESCSQENRDSGVACSQSSGVACSQSSGVACSQNTVTSGLPVSGKDSDSSLSPDSGADTQDFHGIKLSSTRMPSLKGSSVAVDSTQSVAVIDSLASVKCQGADVVESLSHTLYRDSNQIVSVPQTLYQGVDKVDAVQPSSSQGVDEVDAVQPSSSQGVDEVDAVRPSTSRGDDVDCVQPLTSQCVDNVDCVQPSTSRGVDEVDAVWPSMSRDVDKVDSVRTPKSRGVDEVDSRRPSTIRSLNEVDSVRRTLSGVVDEVDLVRSASSQDIDEIDSLQPDFTQCVEEVNLLQHVLSQSVDENDSVRHISSQSVDEVDSVQFTSSDRVDKVDSTPSAVSRGVNEVSTSKLHSVKTQTDLCYISKSDIPNEKPIVDVDKCMTCYSRPLDGIFVHSKYAHMCCCYKCTVRVWKTTKRCPLCNCKVMNVLRLFKGC